MTKLYHPNGGEPVEVNDPVRVEVLKARGYSTSDQSGKLETTKGVHEGAHYGQAAAYPQAGAVPTPVTSEDRVKSLKARQEEELRQIQERQKVELLSAERLAALEAGDVKKAQGIQDELSGKKAQPTPATSTGTGSAKATTAKK